MAKLFNCQVGLMVFLGVLTVQFCIQGTTLVLIALGLSSLTLKQVQHSL